MGTTIELLKFINEQKNQNNTSDFNLTVLANRFNSTTKSIRIILDTYTFPTYSTDGKVVVVSIKQSGLLLIK